jgi:hypothetical protein
MHRELARFPTFAPTHVLKRPRSFIVGLFLRDCLFFRFSVRAASEMRRALCNTIMQAPMLFFMTENLGPLTGVFTRDLSIVSEERAYFPSALNNVSSPTLCLQLPTLFTWE